jgi:predicted outer membrane repeat protein
MSVVDATISDNSSEGGGGAILSGNLNFGAQLTVTGCTISGNSAASGGGGIANFANVTVTDSTLSSNSAGFGGGMANYFGMLTVIGSTLSDNHANGTGGGIIQIIGQIRLRNTIVAGNTGFDSSDLFGTFNSQGHNLIGDSTGGNGFIDTDLVGTSDNPIDPLLGPLQDNGGPTFTMALLDGSPAIDAGDNTDAPEWDQRGPGFPRIVGIIDPDNPIIDIGAFEVQAQKLARPGVLALFAQATGQAPSIAAATPRRLELAANLHAPTVPVAEVARDEPPATNLFFAARADSKSRGEESLIFKPMEGWSDGTM